MCVCCICMCVLCVSNFSAYVCVDDLYDVGCVCLYMMWTIYVCV